MTEDEKLIVDCMEERNRLIRKARAYMDKRKRLFPQIHELSIPKLAEKFNLSKDKVKYLLDKHGVVRERL